MNHLRIGDVVRKLARTEHDVGMLHLLVSGYGSAKRANMSREDREMHPPKEYSLVGVFENGQQFIDEADGAELERVL